MNFYPTKVARIGGAALALVSLVAPSIASANSTSIHATRKAKVSTVLPTVSNHPGVAPVIGKPAGPAPTTLITKDIIVGKGAAALTSSTVTAQYVVMSWKTGVVYQTSWTAQPFTAPLSNLILGWQKGIPGMKIGGRRLFVIPPALAYGAQGAGNIPANETLVFVVDLLGVK